jgi:hypothetical protein
MSTGVSADLYDSTNASYGDPLDDISNVSPYDMPPDWEASSWDGLSEQTSGPYCVGDQITIHALFSGEQDNFSTIKDYNPNYTRETEQNVNFLSQTGYIFEYEAASKGTGKVEISFASPFTTLTDEGTIYSVTFDIIGLTVSCDNWEWGDCDGDGS